MWHPANTRSSARVVAFSSVPCLFHWKPSNSGGDNLQWVTEKKGKWHKIIASCSRMKTPNLTWMVNDESTASFRSEGRHEMTRMMPLLASPYYNPIQDVLHFNCLCAPDERTHTICSKVDNTLFQIYFHIHLLEISYSVRQPLKRRELHTTLTSNDVIP